MKGPWTLHSKSFLVTNLFLCQFCANFCANSVPIFALFNFSTVVATYNIQHTVYNIQHTLCCNMLQHSVCCMLYTVCCMLYVATTVEKLNKAKIGTELAQKLAQNWHRNKLVTKNDFEWSVHGPFICKKSFL